MSVTTITAFVDNAQFTPALIDGPFDGSPAAWRDSQREQALLFSEPTSRTASSSSAAAAPTCPPGRSQR